MNHARLRTSRQDPSFSESSLRKRLAAVVQKLYHRANKPASFASSPQAHLWTVTATLTREAAFGTVSIQSVCSVRASSRSEALAMALQRIAERHPSYSCATIRADAGPGG